MVCSGNEAQGNISMPWKQPDGYAEPLSKAMNGKLHGRGGGNSLMAQNLPGIPAVCHGCISGREQNHKGWYYGIESGYN